MVHWLCSSPATKISLFSSLSKMTLGSTSGKRKPIWLMHQRCVTLGTSSCLAMNHVENILQTQAHQHALKIIAMFKWALISLSHGIGSLFLLLHLQNQVSEIFKLGPSKGLFKPRQKKKSSWNSVGLLCGHHFWQQRHWTVLVWQCTLMNLNKDSLPPLVPNVKHHCFSLVILDWWSTFLIGDQEWTFLGNDLTRSQCVLFKNAAALAMHWFSQFSKTVDCKPIERNKRPGRSQDFTAEKKEKRALLVSSSRKEFLWLESHRECDVHVLSSVHPSQRQSSPLSGYDMVLRVRKQDEKEKERVPKTTHALILGDCDFSCRLSSSCVVVVEKQATAKQIFHKTWWEGLLWWLRLSRSFLHGRCRALPWRRINEMSWRRRQPTPQRRRLAWQEQVDVRRPSRRWNQQWTMKSRFPNFG